MSAPWRLETNLLKQEGVASPLTKKLFTDFLSVLEILIYNIFKVITKIVPFTPYKIIRKYKAIVGKLFSLSIFKSVGNFCRK